MAVDFKSREVVIIVVLVLIVSTLGVCSMLRDQSPDQGEYQLPDVLVHVAGAVRNPGVYRLPGGSRVFDAIEMAGGELEEADLHRLNLAAQLTDEQRIYVPQMVTDWEQEEGGLININHANQRTLEELPGIGPEIARRIIQYRELHGGFASIEDIMNVDRIGPKTFESIKELITVD